MDFVLLDINIQICPVSYSVLPFNTTTSTLPPENWNYSYGLKMKLC